MIPFASATTHPTMTSSRAAVAQINSNVVSTIQNIIQAEGTTDNGVLSISIDRDDITNVTLHGVPMLPAFQIHGDLDFQSINQDGDKDGDDTQVILNGDMALKESEVMPFLDQLLSHGIVFQAEHQHFYDFHPEVWFIHFRKTGSASTVAHDIKAALNVTSTPFPQTMPNNPTTPLPKDEIAQILGNSASVESDGIVHVDVPRNDFIVLGGIHISPYLNVQTPVDFEPNGGGQNAAVVADFGMTAKEVQPVVKLMRSLGWDVGCLYNQETDEQPQLYFAHMFKKGNSVTLAREVREGLNLMNMHFSS